MSFTFKILLIGDPGVGKKSFLHRSYYGGFISSYDPVNETYTERISIDYDVYIIFLDITVINNYADIDKNKSLFHSFDAVILMFDLTSRNSYISISNCYKTFISFFKDKPIILLGNKFDLHEKWDVDVKKLESNQLGKEIYINLSIKAKINVNLVWERLIYNIFKYMKFSKINK
jgi:small GTP-binding protein